MNQNKLPNRQSIRLQGYDYSCPGFYFITFCTYRREHLFGEILNGKMILNRFGEVAYNEWIKTESIRDNVILDSFVVMPNHIHGIIEIIDVDNKSVGVNCNLPLRDHTNNDHTIYRTKFESPSNNIGAIIRGYKSSVTKQINIIRKTPGTKIWHRNYYDHIIRDERSLFYIREYINNNPENWQKDGFRSTR